MKIEESEGKYRGKLTVVAATDVPGVREVSATSCDEVVSALALVTALSIDPEAKTEPLDSPMPPPLGSEPSRAEPPAPQPGPAEIAPPAEEPAVEPIAPPALPLPSGLDQPAAPTEAEEHPAEPPWILSVGAQAELVSAVVPDLLVVPRVWADVGPGKAGFWSPRAGISVAGWSTRVQAESGEDAAQLTWLSGRLEGCPLNVTGSLALALRPCLAVDAGLLHGSGIASEGLETQEHSRVWLAGSALLRLEVRASESLQLRVQAGLVAPFLRPSFVFENRAAGSSEYVPIHSVPDWGGCFGLGAGLNLPF